MDYKELIEELYKRRTKGIKLGLDRVFKALEKLGNPHKNFKSIHIAGTNGKGSVSRILYNLLRFHGESTGIFTSPHLTRFTERIVVNDKEISKEDVVRLIKKIRPFSDDLTFFEYITVMAFLYFNEKGVEYVVLETGMGGRLDATNVVQPLISVITKIGLDHQEFLGNDIASIAQEKAGIIKRESPVISASQEKVAENVIIKRAKDLNSPLLIYSKDFEGKLKSLDFNGVFFDFHPAKPHLSNISPLLNLFISLIGLHQVENASLALQAFMKVYPMWKEHLVREALKGVSLPGRIEILSLDPLVVFDIAHNPQAIESLVKSLKTLTNKRPIVVLGIMKDKDVQGMIRALEGYAEKIIFTSPKYERALIYEELLQRLNGSLINIAPSIDPISALKEAMSFCKINREFFTLCTGSAYLIGELKELLGENSLYRNLGELP